MYIEGSPGSTPTVTPSPTNPGLFWLPLPGLGIGRRGKPDGPVSPRRVPLSGFLLLPFSFGIDVGTGHDEGSRTLSGHNLLL